MVLWGSSFLPIYPSIMKAWTPIVLLMSARNSLMTLGSFWAFLEHGERHEDSSGVCEGDTYFLFCSEGGPSSFHSSARVCIPRFSSLLRPSRAVVKASGYAARYAGVPGAAFDCLDASSDTLSPCCMATASLRQYILWYLWLPHGCGPLEELALGWMALTERGDLLELWNHVSVFYWQLALSAECVKKTQACRQTFLRSSGRAWLCSWAFAMMSLTVAAKILALASLPLASL